MASTKKAKIPPTVEMLEKRVENLALKVEEAKARAQKANDVVITAVVAHALAVADLERAKPAVPAQQAAVPTDGNEEPR